MSLGTVWDEELLMGDPAIDGQHLELFALVARLGDEIKAGSGDQSVERILEELIGYAAIHFRDEEELMARAGYPGLESQRTAHAAFAEDATRMMKEWATGAGVESHALQDYLHSWLTKHVETADLLLARFLRAERAAGEFV